MRKILGVLVGILVFLGGREAFMAQEINLRPEDILATSSEREEISVLKEEMIDGMLAWNGISKESETEYEEAKQYYMQNAEIHYDEAVKIHSSTYLFQLDTDDEGTILDYLDQGEHIWMVPVSLDGKKYMMTVTKGLPLREDVKDILTTEQQQEVIDREGKWFVVGIGEGVPEGETDDYYWEMLLARSEALAQCQQVVLIMDLPGFQYPVALGFQDGKAASWIGLGYQYSIMEDAAEEAELMSQSAGTEQEKVFEYHELANRMEEYYNPSSDLNGGGGRVEKTSSARYWAIGGAAAVIAAVAVVVLIKRRTGKS